MDSLPLTATLAFDTSVESASGCHDDAGVMYVLLPSLVLCLGLDVIYTASELWRMVLKSGVFSNSLRGVLQEAPQLKAKSEVLKASS